MTTKEQLIGLLFQIRGATSKLEKLKLAALAWRTLRGLDRHERLVVAKELGLGGAERLVDQLGSAGGLNPAALLSAIRQAEEAEPDDLRELLDGVMDPERRDELLAGALHSAGDWLAEHELPPVPNTVPATSTDTGTDSDTDTDTVPVTEIVGAGVPPAASQPATDPPDEPNPEAESGTGAGSMRQPDLEAQEPQEPQTPSPQNPKTPGLQDCIPSSPEQCTQEDLLTRLTSDISSFKRLRLLASEDGRIRKLDLAQLVAVVEVFPPGWARRRALESLLKRGVPEDVHSALELVGLAGDEVAQHWVLTVLAGRPGLTEEEQEQVMAAAEGSPALARKVANRLAR